jgi:hypothetical protein
MKIVLSVFFAIFALILVAASIVCNDVLYARNLEVNGVVSAIDWRSSNHLLPKFLIREENGRDVVISHSSVALTEKDVKVGDHLQKIRGSNFCLINGRRTQFSRYLGSGSYIHVMSYLYRQIRYTHSRIDVESDRLPLQVH